MPISIRFGIPRHGPWDHNMPGFEQEGVNVLRLDDFPPNDSPSGGISDRISPSEMFLVQASDPRARQFGMVWKGPEGNVINDTVQFGNGMYEFLGRFSGEIDKRGKYTVEVRSDTGKEIVPFEVV